MQEKNPTSSPLRFGTFELHLNSGELYKQTRRVKLQEQPLQLLSILLEQPGDLVTREELQKRLWPADTFVDFERGLNRAVNKVREALGDEAASPRFIETLPRRGYRFIAPVTNFNPREAPPGDPVGLLPPLPSEPNDPPKLGASIRREGTRRFRLLLWMLPGCVGVVVLFSYWRPWLVRQQPLTKPFLQFDLNVSPDEFANPAVSSDGTRIAFVSKGSLALRRFDQANSTSLAGTEGALLPFFSPSGKWIAFFAREHLFKIAVEGGAPMDLCRAPHPAGGTWIDEDHIVAALDLEGLSRISAVGGAPQRLTHFNLSPFGTRVHVWPQALPGGKGILFGAEDGSAQGSLQILTFSDGKITKILEGSDYGRCIAGDFLIYFRHGTLFGASLNLQRLQLAGPAMPLLSGVADPGGLGRPEFDISNTGTLVYRGGLEGTTSIPAWLYRSGKTERALPESGQFLTPRLSPDGNRLATALIEEGEQKLWIYDFHRSTWTRVTSDLVPELLPTWTPDGEFLAFRSGTGMAWARSDGSGMVQRLAGVSSNAGPWSFSGDGKWLAFWPLEPGSNLWSVPVTRPSNQLRLGKPQILLADASSSKGAPAISPDSRWLAYSSNESGRFEVYVVPFAAGERAAKGKWPVSNSGGLSPVWSPNGRELLFQSLDHYVEVVAYAAKGDSFLPGQPRAWTKTRLAGTGMFQAFDVAPGGKRLLALMDAETLGSERAFHVYLNVDDELRRRAAGSTK